MGPLFLHGGGRDPDPARWRPFLAATGADRPQVAVAVLAGDGPDEAYARWLFVLRGAGACVPRRVDISPAEPLTPEALTGADALFVAHGLTPAYSAAVAPHAEALRALEIPYAGSSAGAAIAPGRALVGGWLLDGRPVCPDDAAEELDELTVKDGLGLLDLAVDVHAAQWGTLGRLAAAVDAGLVAGGIALDEEAILRVDGAELEVTGQAWRIAGRGLPLERLTG